MLPSLNPDEQQKKVRKPSKSRVARVVPGVGEELDKALGLTSGADNAAARGATPLQQPAAAAAAEQDVDSEYRARCLLDAQTSADKAKTRAQLLGSSPSSPIVVSVELGGGKWSTLQDADSHKPLRWIKQRSVGRKSDCLRRLPFTNLQ